MMTHIVEDPRTESIDWKRFYGDTVNDVTRWGPRAWNLVFDWAENIPCPHCREFAVTAVSALRDMVNLHKQKGEFAGKIFDMQKFKTFVSMVHEAEKQNPHSVHFEHKRLETPSHLDPESFRTVKEGDHNIIIGCPVGHFVGGSCNVGTRAQAILHRID